MPLPAASADPGNPEAANGGKPLRILSRLLQDIADCRAERARRENALADLERRLQGELVPLEAQMLDLRMETFRILGRHLRSGRLNRKANGLLESALYDLAADLEREGVDMEADRNAAFGESGAGAGWPGGAAGLISENGDEEEDDSENEDGDGAGAFRASDFPDRERGGAGQKPRDRAGPEMPMTRPDEALAGDVRALYLLLARALHPDKEADPARREGKTAWMQKVTAAYADRDLARLLDILAADPLRAVGPYLSGAPRKVLEGYGKRLRRDLESLRHGLAALDAGLDPFRASLLKEGNINETAWSVRLAEARKDVKLMKQRRDAYRTEAGVIGLADALRSHDWRELL
jgi:hypothetical protein